MRANRLSNTIALAAAFLGGAVFITELANWLSHLRRPRPSLQWLRPARPASDTVAFTFLAWARSGSAGDVMGEGHDKRQY